MPVDIAWDNAEKTVMLIKYVGVWTWDEVYAAVEQSYALHDTVQHPVANINDFSHSVGFPNLALSHTRRLIERRHPNVGTVVVVWDNRLMQITWQVFAKVYTPIVRRHTFLLATSVEEARKMLKNPPHLDQQR